MSGPRTPGGRRGAGKTPGSPSVPRTTWGDNVVLADFGARRRADLEHKHGKKSVRPALGSVEQEGWAPRQLMEGLAARADTARLARGREYYRAGNVLDVSLDVDVVHGEVAGTQLEPFSVMIQLTPLTPRQRSYVAGELESDSAALRALLAGKRPPLDIATILLHPGHVQSSVCSCPDRHPVCKHAVALGYSTAAVLQERPLEVCRWRGVEVNPSRALEPIGRADGAADANGGAPGNAASTGQGGEGRGDAPGSDGAPEASGSPFAEGRTVDPDAFWGTTSSRVFTPDFPVELGLDVGDRQALLRALRTVSWTSVNQIAILHDLELCYEALVDEDDRFDPEPWAPGDGPSP